MSYGTSTLIRIGSADGSYFRGKGTSGDGIFGDVFLEETNVRGTLPVTKGGSGIIGGSSGGILAFTASTTLASSAVLTANGVLLGGGAGAAPTATAAGAANEVFRVPGAGGAPVFGQVALNQSAAITGTLPVGNGGTGATTLVGAFIPKCTQIAYTGNGSDNRSITGAGFQPNWVLANTSQSGITHAWIIKTKTMTGDLAKNSAIDGAGADQIQAFESDGFQLGASIPNVNAQTFDATCMITATA